MIDHRAIKLDFSIYNYVNEQRYGYWKLNTLTQEFNEYKRKVRKKKSDISEEGSSNTK